jgi:hypothetical protein
LGNGGLPKGECHLIKIPIIIIGEEEIKQEPDGNDLSKGERNPFLDTDIRKSLDDKFQFIISRLINSTFRQFTQPSPIHTQDTDPYDQLLKSIDIEENSMAGETPPQTNTAAPDSSPTG